MAFNPKKYTPEFLFAMLLYVAVLVATRLVLKGAALEGFALATVALLPALPAVLATYIFMRHYATMDELYKRVHLEAFASGALFVGLASFSLGFLEDAGLPRISLIWILPALIACWGLVLPILLRRFK